MQKQVVTRWFVNGFGGGFPTGTDKGYSAFEIGRANRVATSFNRLSKTEQSNLEFKIRGHPDGNLLYGVMRRLDRNTFTDREAKALLSPFCIRDGCVAGEILAFLNERFARRENFSVSATELALALRVLSGTNKSPIAAKYKEGIRECC